jgi:chromosomal replication initiator protein
MTDDDEPRSDQATATTADLSDVWPSVAVLLRDQLADAVWYSTFQDASAIIEPDGRLMIHVPNSLSRERILSRYRSIVEDALVDAGLPGLEFDVTVGGDTAHVDAPSQDVPTADSTQVAGAAQAGPNLLSFDIGSTGAGSVTSSPSEAGLNPKYMFETFVKGASNQFALAAALRVAETPARSYNPLFVYGAAGLGKTHLLHAIGHYVHLNYKHHVVRYVSTESFMNEYVDAIRSNSMAGLRRRYREVDVLLIDDVQFLEGKEGLQEEFFHTFNSLHGANKQIVLSSDRMPDAIPTLEERLRGRFKWGLITDIQPPDLETRLAILRNKAERDRVQVPSDTLEFIASNITSNIRELEGALIRVTAYASLNSRPITTELAQEQLADLLTEAVSKPRTDMELLTEIADILGFDVDSLRGKSRQRPLVTARQIAMYVFRELTDLSYPSIARLFGGRDHTTVIHAVEKIQRQMGERKQIYEQVTDLLQRLKS